MESVQGRGSTFRFEATFSLAAWAADASTQELNDLTGKLVLVVDDNDTNRLIVGEICTVLGMNIRAASSARKALELIAAGLQTDEEFSLILLDRVLPDANGFETLDEIRRFDKDVPVIILSSDQEPKDLTQAQSPGSRSLPDEAGNGWYYGHYEHPRAGPEVFVGKRRYLPLPRTPWWRTLNGAVRPAAMHTWQSPFPKPD